MRDWFFGLSMFPAMTLVVFGLTYLVAAGIALTVSRLAVGERARAFKTLSALCLPPLGATFAFLLIFGAAPVWTNFNDAKRAVATEASGLRDVLILARGMSGETETRLRTLVDAYVTRSATREWPAMAANRIARETDNPCRCSGELEAALADMRGLTLADDRQRVDRQDIVKALETVRDARRQRIEISEDDTGTIRFTGIAGIGACLMIWVALVHAHERRAQAIGMAVFGTVIAMATLLIVSYSNPFSGGHVVSPRILQEVLDGIPAHAALTPPSMVILAAD